MSTLLQKVQSGELNPIIFLPMVDASTAHINYGYGGNFSVNGTYATSNRGANQDNCVASYFDGVADYLSRTSLTGVADGKQFTLSWSGTRKTKLQAVLQMSNALDAYQVYVYINTGGNIGIEAKNQAGTGILSAIYTPAIPISKNFTLSLSVDLSNVANRKIIFNGVDVSASVNWLTYTNDTIDFTTTMYRVMANNGTSPDYSDGNIGELYFDTKYIDLATSNPFWDSVENKPIPVRKVIADTGVTPLIAMPLDASNAGKNYGTGGDFTANSAPYVGARGASEAWARSAKFVTSTLAKLTRVVAIPAFNTASIVICHKLDAITSADGFAFQMLNAGSTAGRFYFQATTSEFQVSSNGVTLGHNRTLAANTWEVIFLSFDKTTLANNKLIVNNASLALTNFEFLNSVQYANDEVRIGQSSTYFNGQSAMYYFTTDYIDFSQEVNRLKFVDAFNMPLDLARQIDKGIIPKPLIYLPFSDTTNFGKNLGTGGDFVVNGSITAGSDVNG